MQPNHVHFERPSIASPQHLATVYTGVLQAVFSQLRRVLAVDWSLLHEFDRMGFVGFLEGVKNVWRGAGGILPTTRTRSSRLVPAPSICTRNSVLMRRVDSFAERLDAIQNKSKL